MKKIFQVNNITYDLNDSNILCQPKFYKITYAKNILSWWA